VSPGPPSTRHTQLEFAQFRPCEALLAGFDRVRAAAEAGGFCRLTSGNRRIPVELPSTRSCSKIRFTSDSTTYALNLKNDGKASFSVTYSCVEAVGSEDQNCLTTGLGAKIATEVHHAYSLIAIWKLK